MTSRILVADDSLTIQKVIGITLSTTGHELVECLNEEVLFKKIQSNHFDLVLLDFNLSDTRSGYELAKQIHSLMPDLPIIVMLGTFDTIDESQFFACGISDKIIKPFESSKFIKKCKDLLEGTHSKISEPVEKENTLEAQTTSGDDSENDDLDLWKVDAPKVAKNSEEDLFSSHQEKMSALDPLNSEIEGWGFTPVNTLEDRFQKTFPPAIEEENLKPDILNRLQASSSFIEDKDFLSDADETDPSFEIPEDLNRSLLSEIEEEVSAESFWAVDEVLPLRANEYNDIVDTNLEEVTADLTETVQKFKRNESTKAASKVIPASNEEEADTIIHMDQDELVEKLKNSLKPMIEEMVKEFCRQNAEKIAWEVIPDLAENLIKKEIKEIANSIEH